MSTANEQWLVSIYQQAKQASHIFPGYAACEAANESAWGKSELYQKALNVFGCKQHLHHVYGTFNLPTKECLKGKWVVIDAEWIEYPTAAACFEDRMRTLRALAPAYPHYAAALAAKDGVTYVNQVSQSWSTDPERAHKVLEIYAAHGHLLT